MKISGPYLQQCDGAASTTLTKEKPAPPGKTCLVLSRLLAQSARSSRSTRICDRYGTEPRITYFFEMAAMTDKATCQTGGLD
jgi:hypothetical protein